MNTFGKMGRLLRLIVLVTASGTLFASGCSSSQLQAVLTGVEAAASVLDDRDRFDGGDISFGDWLSSEVRDF